MDWSRASLLALLRERGVHPKRHLGQNFLLDRNFLDAIVREAGVGGGDGVIEIGSGLGSLTERLASKAGHVWAFEIDPEIHELSVELLGGRKNVTIFNLDGAEFADHIDPRLCKTLKIVSNLPYSDYHRILLRLLSTKLEIERMVLMLQRDVYDRLRSAPGTRGYGPLGVILQGLCATKFLRRAGPGLFHPPPRVDSVLFEVRRRPGGDFACDPGEIPRLEKALRELFAQRRKTASNAWKRLTGEALDEEGRIEDLAPARLLTLAAMLES